MNKLSLPSQPIPSSQIVLGGLVFCEDQEERWGAILDAYFEAGGNFIDTAHAYGGGQSERVIGRWLAKRGVRDRTTLLTKGCHPARGEWLRVRPEVIHSDLLESLERLQVDQIDIYLLHRDDPDVGVDELIDALNEHVRAGRVRTIGASNWRVERILQANAYAEARGLQGFVINSPHFSLAEPKEELWRDCLNLTADELAWHKMSRFPLLAWSAQARGFFSDDFSPDRTDHALMTRVYDSKTNWERLRRAEVLGKAKGVTGFQIALAYVLWQPFPCFAVIGPETMNQLQASLGAIPVQLDPAELAWLDGRSADPPPSLEGV